MQVGYVWVAYFCMQLGELQVTSGLCMGCIQLYVACGVVGCKWVVYGLCMGCIQLYLAWGVVGCKQVVYRLCMGYIYLHVVVVFMIIDPYKFMVGYCNKIPHKICLSTGPIPFAASCFLPQEKRHPNPKTKSFPFISLTANHDSAFTIQYLFEFCFHFYNACK